MGVELKLDTNALMSLFPEGSEARIILQKAVVAEAVRRIGTTQAQKLVGEFETTFTNAARSAAEAAVKDFLVKGGDYWALDRLSNKALGEEVKSRVKELVTQQLNYIVSTAVDEALNGAVQEKTNRTVERLTAEIDKKVAAVTDHYIKTAVAARFNSALSKVSDA